MVRVTVDKVGLDINSDQAVVLLKDVDGRVLLPIWIGPIEASAIAMSLQGVRPPRPLTCDLLKSVLDCLDARVTMATVNDLKDDTFFARVFVESGGKTLEIDSRPSDAVALALRTGVRPGQGRHTGRRGPVGSLNPWANSPDRGTFARSPGQSARSGSRLWEILSCGRRRYPPPCRG
jgi:bifunctional DNase/RNase